MGGDINFVNPYYKYYKTCKLQLATCKLQVATKHITSTIKAARRLKVGVASYLSIKRTMDADMLDFIRFYVNYL